MSTFKKIYKKVANNGDSNDYQEVGTVGVNGVNLDIMKGASSSVDGEIGLVPKPTKGHQNQYLRADGTWQTPPDTNTTYGVFTGSNNGLVPSTDKSTYFLTGNGTWGYPWIGSWTESGKTVICLGSGDDQLSKNEIPEATISSNGLMSSKDKSIVTDLLRNATCFLFWFDVDINFGTIKGGGETPVYKSQEYTKYIYENKTDDSNFYIYYPLLKKVAESNGKLGYEPINSGCSFGNFDSLWNEGYATCKKVTKNNKNAIEIFFRVYANARSYAGTHSVTGKAKVFFYLQGEVRSLLYD